MPSKLVNEYHLDQGTWKIHFYVLELVKWPLSKKALLCLHHVLVISSVMSIKQVFDCTHHNTNLEFGFGLKLGMVTDSSEQMHITQHWDIAICVTEWTNSVRKNRDPMMQTCKLHLVYLFDRNTEAGTAQDVCQTTSTSV